MLNRLSPPVIWKCAIAVWAAAFLMYAGSQWNWWHIPVNTGRLVFSPIAAAAYAVALVICWEIAAEHRDSPGMRQAWIMLAASAGFSVLRHLALGAISVNLDEGPDSLAGYLLTQGLMILSLVSLTAGLFFIWRTFRLLDLGFHPHAVDIAMFVLIVVLVPPIMLSRSFVLPADDHRLVPVLRYGGAILLPISTAMAIQLHRVAMQMRGGAMARVLQVLVLFTGGRLLMMLASAVPAFRGNPLVFAANQAIMQAIPLLFTLAAGYRWQITGKARAAVAEAERAMALI